MQSRSKSLIPLAGALLVIAWSPVALAQYRCNVNGQVVFQETSCVAPGAPAVNLEKMSAQELQAYHERESKRRASPPPKPEPAGYELRVPSDPGATFVVLEMKNGTADGRLREIVTKRIGRAGHVSYSRRLYDCHYSQVKYLGSGGTYEQMAAGKPDPNMSGITSGSIADYVGREACK